MSGEPQGARFVPELEGLRGAAIAAVLGYHLKLPGFSYGPLGVNLFFALSAFLITGILADTAGRPGWLKNFYARRALRIFPAYYVVVIACAILAVALGKPTADLPWYLTYVQNVLLGRTDFHPRFPPILDHTWSLAVEEQFYLCWPLVVAALPRRGLAAACVLLWLLAPLYRFWILRSGHPTSLAWVLPPGQADALAAGALAALALRSPRAREWLRPRAGPLAAAGAIACLALGAWIGGGSGDLLRDARGAAFLAIFSISAAFLILHLAGGGGNRVFAATPLRLLGRVSYGLYLVHWPVIVVVTGLSASAGGRMPDAAVIPLSLALSLGLAAISWRWFESPILRLKARFG